MVAHQARTTAWYEVRARFTTPPPANKCKLLASLLRASAGTRLRQVALQGHAWWVRGWPGGEAHDLGLPEAPHRVGHPQHEAVGVVLVGAARREVGAPHAADALHRRERSQVALQVQRDSHLEAAGPHKEHRVPELALQRRGGARWLGAVCNRSLGHCLASFSGARGLQASRGLPAPGMTKATPPCSVDRHGGRQTALPLADRDVARDAPSGGIAGSSLLPWMLVHPGYRRPLYKFLDKQSWAYRRGTQHRRRASVPENG